MALHDDAEDFHGTWVPGSGMLGASLVHRGQELLWSGTGVASYAAAGTLVGIPFLHPWANRLGDLSYRAGGHDVALDSGSPLLRFDDSGLPIHGALTASRDWRLEALEADGMQARLLAEHDYERPELLAIFPFPHRIEMEVCLAGAAVEVIVTLTATGAESVPVAFGFHPHLRLPDVPRDKWEVTLPVGHRLLHDERLIPTGATEDAAPIIGEIGERTWDDGFDRIDEGTRFEIRSGRVGLAIEFLEGYPIAHVLAPPGEDYLCLKPMSAPADALRGPDAALVWVPPGGRHRAAFRITSIR